MRAIFILYRIGLLILLLCVSLGQQTCSPCCKSDISKDDVTYVENFFSSYSDRSCNDMKAITGCKGDRICSLSISEGMGEINNTNFGFLAGLDSLEILNLTSLNISGPIPDPFAWLVNLNYLKVQNCRITGLIPRFGSFLHTIDLSRNQITGTRDTYFWTYVEYLDLSENELAGELTGLGSLLSLSYLNVSHNNLNGSLPSHVWPPTLQIMDFSANKFTGNISGNYTRLASVFELDVSSNDLTGKIPEDLFRLQMISKMNLSRNFLSGSIPSTFLDSQTLAYLDLSSNNLSGNVSFLKGSLSPLLATLDFSNNLLSGDISFLLNSTTFSTISLNLSLNFLSLEKSSTTQGCRTTSVNATYDLSKNCIFDGNVSCHFGSQRPISDCSNFCNATQENGACGGNGDCLNPNGRYFYCSCHDGFYAFKKKFSCEKGSRAINTPPVLAPSFPIVSPSLPAPQQPPSSTKKQLLLLSSIIGLALLILITVLCACFYCYFVNNKSEGPATSYNDLRRQSSFDERVRQNFVQSLPLEQVMEITSGFSDNLIIGQGGFGLVYKAVSISGETWAVKRAVGKEKLRVKEFQREVDIISRMFHKNILPLRGYCSENGEKILIYDFMPNGSLRSILNNEHATFTFEERLRIATEVAEGLKYLHFHANPTVIHRDVKSENILLDGQMQARLADFGFLKDAASSGLETHQVVGTTGYVDPEYYATCEVTKKSDVYSFGIVLLEILTRKPAILRELNPPVSLVNHVAHNNWEVEALMDPKLGGRYSRADAAAMFQLAKECTSQRGEHRPSSEEVSLRLGALKHSNSTSFEIESEDSEIVPAVEHGGNRGRMARLT